MQLFGAQPFVDMMDLTQQVTMHARMVYAGGLPPTADEKSVAKFFNHVMYAIGANTSPEDAVVNVYINHERKFAYVEMRSVEEASNAMALDGIMFEGAPIRVRRPDQYNPCVAAMLGPSQPSPNLNLAIVGLTPRSTSTGGLDGPDCLFVSGLPYYITEAQIKVLLESFGPLRSLDLVKNSETGRPECAFCVYQDVSVTDIACGALNGLKLGDQTLNVRRADQVAMQTKPDLESALLRTQQEIAFQRFQLLQLSDSVATRVVCLTQAVTEEELKDDLEYRDIVEDMKQEGKKYGSLMSVVIPRPRPDGEPSSGVGRVFLEFADVDGSTKARTGMNGRKFGGNPVEAVFYPESKFAQGDYNASC